MRSARNNRSYNYRPNRDNRQEVSGEAVSDQKWKAFYQKLKKGMSGSEEQKETILRKRILKNFQNYNLESHLFYIQRRDLNPNSIDLAMISESSLFIYGIDFMSEASIRQYFNPFEVEINIYDDSHCQIRYKSSLHLMQSFYSKLLEKPQNLNAFYSVFKANHGEMVQWREIEGYTQMMIQRRLWARFATKYDFDQKRQKSSRAMIETFETAKSKFMARHEKITKTAQPEPFGRLRIEDSGKYNANVSRQLNKSSCCISQKMTRLMQMFMCSCHEHASHKVKKHPNKRTDSPQTKERERSRDERHKFPKKNNYSLNALKQLSTPLPIIQEITKPCENHSQKIQSGSQEMEMNLNLSIPAIDHKEELQHSKDVLFLDMLKEFSRYSPFSDLNESKKISNTEDSQSLYSYYECDDNDEQ